MILHLKIKMLLMSRREKIFCGVVELKADSCILKSSSGSEIVLGSGLYFQTV